MIIKIGIQMKNYRSHAHTISSCRYHFVWCRKYRHPVLGFVQDEETELFTDTADHFGHEILALEIADDHVHLFVQTDAKHSPADVARQFKSYSGKHILEQRPEIRESYFWGGGF